MSELSQKFGLEPTLLKQICQAFDQVPQLKWVKMYGSRAKGTHRPNSDIDLAYLSEYPEDLTGKIWSILDNLPTPYQFDVTNYALIKNKNLKEHIDRVGVAL